MIDIFISYKREDQPFARSLAKALTESGWNTWWDPALVAGERYDDVIQAALEECRCTILLWTASAAGSKYVRDEANFALDADKLVPIRLDDTELPFRFSGLHTLDFSNWDETITHPVFQRLVSDLSSKIGAPGEPIEFIEKSNEFGTAPWWRLAVFRYSVAGAVVLMAFVGIWRWQTPDPPGDVGDPCYLSVKVEPVGHQDDVFLLERIASGETKKLAATTLQLEASHLAGWRVNVVWDSERGPSTTEELQDCRDFDSVVSTDGMARISFSVVE